MPKRTTKTDTWEQLRAHALSLPEAWEDHPWGEVVVKVNKKVFVFLGMPDSESPGMSVKLTDGHGHAESVAGATPTGYGLGKAGWMSIPLAGADTEILSDWIEESYRNVATKKLIARLDAARQ